MQKGNLEDIKLHKYFPVFLQAIIYLFSLILFKIFCRFEVRGIENIKNIKEPIIFASNHSSEWDGVLMRVALPFFWKNSPMYYVSMPKDKYVNSGWRKSIYGGKLFQLLGAYPIYSGRRNYSFSLQNFLKVLSVGGAVCIFPEGKRTNDGSFGEAHGGVAYLSHSTKTPVVPVGVSGLVGFNVKELFLRRRKVFMNFGKPISSEKIVKSTHPEVSEYKDGAKIVMTKIKELISKEKPVKSIFVYKKIMESSKI